MKRDPGEEITLSLKQLKNLFDFLKQEKQGTFRYIIYTVLGFKSENYTDLYYTGLMEFKDMIYGLRNENAKLLMENGGLRRELYKLQSRRSRE